MQEKNSWTPMPLVPVSWGEVFDKITILQIKLARIQNPAKAANVEKELRSLSLIAGDVARFPAALPPLIEALRTVNSELWDIEEGKRQAEKSQTFDAAFIALARAVYIKNDRRAALKKEINLLLGSMIIEEKSY
jgi:hypothetical protein